MRTARNMILSACLGLMALGGAAAASDKVTTLNIKAQSVRTALQQFGAQTGLQVSMRLGSKAIDETQVPALSGEYTAEEGLRRLLANTGLTFEFINERMVAVRPVEGKSTAAGAPADQMRLTALGAEDRQGAQEAREDDGRQVVVKDSRVRRTNEPNLDLPRTMDDIQPYYIYDSVAIERSGIPTVEEFIKQRVTMNTVAMTNNQGTGNMQGGGRVGPGAINETKVDLLGLGTGLTLVLVNGRRPAGGSFGSRLNEIPSNLIERIEVLPASASGIYGGNAIGGVINIVLKRDYTGGTVALNFDRSEKANDPKRTASATYGWSMEGGRTRVNVSANWTDSEPMALEDRAELYYKSRAQILQNSPGFFAAGSLPLGALPNIRKASSGTLTLLNGTSLGTNITHLPAGFPLARTTDQLNEALYTNRGVFNLDLPNTAQSGGLRNPLGASASNKSFGVSVQRQMLSWLDLVGDFRYNQGRTDSIWTVGTSSVVVNGSDSSQGASSVNPFRETVAVALPVDYDLPMYASTESMNFFLTADMKLPFRWRGLLDYSHSRNETIVDYDNFDGRNFSNAVQAGAFNPFVDWMSEPFDWAQYTYKEYSKSPSRANQFSLRLSGPLAALPWGSPQLNVALERTISTRPEYTVNTVVNGFNAIPGYTLNYEKQSMQSSAYAEALVPLVREGSIRFLHSLEAQLAMRTDRYVQDTGTTGEVWSNGVRTSYLGGTQGSAPFSDSVEYSTRHYTLGLKYQPIREVALRASVGTGFLPPTLLQLEPWAPDRLPTNSTITDPTLVDANGVPLRYSVQVVGGGNPDLVPQTSRTVNAGLIFTPGGRLKALRVSADYNKTEQEDAIGALGAQRLIDNESTYAARVIRGSNGRITRVINTPVNLFLRANEALNFRLDYGLPTEAGRFNVAASHTTILSVESQASIVEPLYDAVGFPTEGGAAKHKSNLNLNWERGQWVFTWNTTRFGSYHIYGAAGGPNSLRSAGGGVYLPAQGVIPQGGDTVAAQLFHDLTLTYATQSNASGGQMGNLLGGLTLRAGVRNLFGTEPRLDVTSTGNFYRSPYGGSALRSFWFGAQKSF